MVYGFLLGMGVGCAGTPQEALKYQVLRIHGKSEMRTHRKGWTSIQGNSSPVAKPRQDGGSGYSALAASWACHSRRQGVTPCCTPDPSPPCFSSSPIKSHLPFSILVLFGVDRSLYVLVSVLIIVAKYLTSSNLRKELLCGLRVRAQSIKVGKAWWQEWS